MAKTFCINLRPIGGFQTEGYNILKSVSKSIPAHSRKARETIKCGMPQPVHPITYRCEEKLSVDVAWPMLGHTLNLRLVTRPLT